MAHVSQFHETWAIICKRQAGFVLEDIDEKNGEPKYDAKPLYNFSMRYENWLNRASTIHIPNHVNFLVYAV